MKRFAIVRDDDTAEDAFETAVVAAGLAVDSMFGTRAARDAEVDDNGLYRSVAPFGTDLRNAVRDVSGVTIYGEASDWKTWEADSGWTKAE